MISRNKADDTSSLTNVSQWLCLVFHSEWARCQGYSQRCICAYDYPRVSASAQRKRVSKRRCKQIFQELFPVWFFSHILRWGQGGRYGKSKRVRNWINDWSKCMMVQWVCSIMLNATKRRHYTAVPHLSRTHAHRYTNRTLRTLTGFFEGKNSARPSTAQSKMLLKNIFWMQMQGTTAGIVRHFTLPTRPGTCSMSFLIGLGEVGWRSLFGLFRLSRRDDHGRIKNITRLQNK